MKRLPLISTLALGFAAAAPLACAQTFHFPDGRKASIPEARIQGSTIIVPLKTGDSGGSAAITYPIAKLVRIEWPLPAAIAEAEADLKAGRFADALRKVDAVLPTQELFREIPGTWWSQAAVLRAEALARLGREIDADVMIERLRLVEAPPDTLARVELAVATYFLEQGKNSAARARLDSAATSLSDDTSLARFALLRAQLERDEGRTEAALLAYLRVPVFHPDAQDFLPAALLGAAHCYRALGEDARVKTTIATLLQRFPQSPEAAEARRDYPPSS